MHGRECPEGHLGSRLHASHLKVRCLESSTASWRLSDISSASSTQLSDSEGTGLASSFLPRELADFNSERRTCLRTGSAAGGSASQEGMRDIKVDSGFCKALEGSGFLLFCFPPSLLVVLPQVFPFCLAIPCESCELFYFFLFPFIEVGETQNSKRAENYNGCCYRVLLRGAGQVPKLPLSFPVLTLRLPILL